MRFLPIIACNGWRRFFGRVPILGIRRWGERSGDQEREQRSENRDQFLSVVDLAVVVPTDPAKGAVWMGYPGFVVVRAKVKAIEQRRCCDAKVYSGARGVRAVEQESEVCGGL